MLLVSPAYENFPYAHLNENALRPPSWGIFYFGSSSDCVGWGTIVLLNEIYRTATFMSRLSHLHPSLQNHGMYRTSRHECRVTSWHSSYRDIYVASLPFSPTHAESRNVSYIAT